MINNRRILGEDVNVYKWMLSSTPIEVEVEVEVLSIKSTQSPVTVAVGGGSFITVQPVLSGHSKRIPKWFSRPIIS